MSTPSAHSETLFLLEGLADFQKHTQLLLGHTRRQLAILSRTLDAPIYDTEAFVSAISDLARSSRYTQIQILVKDTEPLIDRGHKLARLAQRLSSKITLRKLTLEPENGEMGFMLSDKTGLLYKNDEREYRGFTDTQAAAEVKRLREIFDYLWQYAEPEPRLQILHI
jgi:hypothetical protein